MTKQPEPSEFLTYVDLFGTAAGKPPAPVKSCTQHKAFAGSHVRADITHEYGRTVVRCLCGHSWKEYPLNVPFSFQVGQ
jgi:hypothetical protein